MKVNELIEAHQAWLNDPTWPKPSFQGVDFQGFNLEGVNLLGANLQRAKSDKYTFLAVYGIGSQNRKTLYIPELDRVWCGCFAGTMQEFEVRCAAHKDETHRQAYANAIEYLKKQATIYRKDQCKK